MVEVLTEQSARAIHQASLEILERTGCRVPVAEARELLAGAGARVDGERVRIPADVIERGLRSVQPVTLYNRLGDAVLPLTTVQSENLAGMPNRGPSPRGSGEVLRVGRVTFGALVDTFYVRDPQSGGTRPFLRDDQRWLARVLDGLPNIDWVQCVGQAHDVPANLQTQVAFGETLAGTVKPILAYPYDRQGLLQVLELAEVVAGGRDALRARPFLACASVPAAPLAGTDYNLEILLTCAERGIPVVYYSCPAMGGNSPCSLEGTLALANADWLAALAIHQLMAPGAPWCTHGFTVQLMDMRTTLWAYSAPESQRAYRAVADLAHWYGFPAWGLEMITDVPELDAQAGAELAANAQVGIEAGVEMIHNSGMIGSGKVVAAEALVLADEIIGYLRCSQAPLAVAGAGLREAIELIAARPPLAEYVSDPHTLAHFRDFWYPRVFDRSNFDPTAARAREALPERLKGAVGRLLERHQPEPLVPEMERELEGLLSHWSGQVVG